MARDPGYYFCSDPMCDGDHVFASERCTDADVLPREGDIVGRGTGDDFTITTYHEPEYMGDDEPTPEVDEPPC